MRHFHANQILFPSVLLRGARKGELVWGKLLYTRAIQMLHNPRYAGVFSYGKMKTRRTAEGTMKYLQVPQEKWHVCIRDAHPGYLSYEQWQENQRILEQNAQSYGADNHGCAPREGSALLQGVIV